MITYTCPACGFTASGYDGLRIRDEKQHHQQECTGHEAGFFMPTKDQT